MIGGERNQHGPHAEVDPARLLKRTHTGIDEWIACPARSPCLEVCGVELVFSQAVKRRVHIVEFDRWFIFQLLNEMAAPCQALNVIRQ